MYSSLFTSNMMGNFMNRAMGFAMWSPFPPSPVIADFYMEEFERNALQAAPYKPPYVQRDVVDTFHIWLLGLARLHELVIVLNVTNENKTFTMEFEWKGCLPFLDLLVYRKKVVTLANKVYR